MSVVAAVLLLRDAVNRPPLFHQRGPSARIPPGRDLERGDAVGPEMAIALAEFAPRRNDPYAIEEGQRERPDRPLRGAGPLVGIDDPRHPLRADRLAEG